MRKRGIDTRPVFPAISQYPMWAAKWKTRVNPVARRVANQGINLPSGVCLKREQAAYVCDSIRDILAHRR